MTAELSATFAEAHQRPPEGVWRAPGRVNLIGEHTDYNDGLVLPFALAQGVSAAAARRSDGVLELRSLQAADSAATVRVDELAPGRVTGWAAYPAGVAWLLRDLVPELAGGASLLFDSDLPQGAGLSSSAALECATALALCELYGRGPDAPGPGPGLDRRGLARLCRRAEQDFVGVPCGIMDQAASLLCAAGHALLLDCRTELSAQVPLRLDGLELLVVDTGAPHSLVAGEYAARREQCEEAARALGAAALRDVTDLPGAMKALRDPVLRRRTQHVVTENHRVEAAAGLLRAGEPAEVGALLTASHLSLRDQFEVSWPQADATVAAALRAGARGGRMIGGGFGGSVLVLTRIDRSDRVRETIESAYQAKGWPPPAFLPADPAPAAHRAD